jgi:hypothetical protein
VKAGNGAADKREPDILGDGLAQLGDGGGLAEDEQGSLSEVGDVVLRDFETAWENLKPGVRKGGSVPSHNTPRDGNVNELHERESWKNTFIWTSEQNDRFALFLFRMTRVTDVQMDII